MTTTPRRRILRPDPATAPRRDPHRWIQKLRSRLEREQATLTRWMSKLKRAFHVVERTQAQVARIERQMAHLEEET